MTEFPYNPFLFQLPLKLLFLPSTFSECIVKFGIHHLYYKKKLRMIEFIYNSRLLYSNKLVSNPTRFSICAINCFYFRYGLGSLRNLS